MNGYTMIASIDTSSSYDWAVFAVFKRDSDGQLFYGDDSGCSCSMAFESESDLTPLREYYPFFMAARRWARDHRTMDTSVDLLAKVNELRDKIKAQDRAEQARQLEAAREALRRARTIYTAKLTAVNEAQESADYALTNLEEAQLKFNRLLDSQSPVN